MIAILDLFGYKKSIEIDKPHPIYFIPLYTPMKNLIENMEGELSAKINRLVFRLIKPMNTENDVFLYEYDGVE